MKAIISVVGLDQPGIVAAVSTVLAKHRVNINDINQSYAHEFFTMILVVDFTQADATLKQVNDEMQEAGKKLGLFVTVQHEDVFKAMHRI